MPEDRPPLKIVKTEPRIPEGRRWDSETYAVYLSLNRNLTSHERDWMNRGGGVRPLGISNADPSRLPRTMMIHDTTIEKVADARDDIKAFLVLLESEGRAAEVEAEKKKAADESASTAETNRRRAIADSIDWN